jgi:hypothetical protein
MAVRPMQPSDYEGVNRLYRSVGWPERSIAGWRWLEENPARIETGAPVGWVIADEADAPVAVVGNLVQRFQAGPRSLHGATGFSIVVPPSRAGASRSLIRAVLKQPGLFAAYTFNANPKAAPLYKHFGLRPYPDETHALKLSWRVDWVASLRGRLLRGLYARARAEDAHRIGERLLNRRLDAPRPLRLPVTVQVLSDLSDRSPYAAYWRALSAATPLLADRSPETMRWRLSDPDQTRAPILLACVREGAIRGVAMAMIAKTSIVEPPSLDVIDVTTLPGEDEAARLLVRTLIDNARGLGAAKVRLPMTSPGLLAQLGPLASRARKEGGWGHCHARILDETLAAQWSPTPFDGDFSICLRPAPLRPGRAARRPSPAVGRVAKA